MLVIVAAFLIAFIWFAPRAFRLIRVEYLATLALLKRFYLSAKQSVYRLAGGPQLAVAGSGGSVSVDILGAPEDVVTDLRCIAGKGVRGLRHSVGYLKITGDCLIFVTRRSFRRREHRIDRNTIADIDFKKRLLLDRLIISTNGRQQQFYFFKDTAHRSQRAYELLQNHKKQKLN